MALVPYPTPTIARGGSLGMGWARVIEAAHLAHRAELTKPIESRSTGQLLAAIDCWSLSALSCPVYGVFSHTEM